MTRIGDGIHDGTRHGNRNGTGNGAVLRLPGLLLGAGLGGFVDGVVLHQILQWHHLLSSAGSDRLGLPRHDPGTLRGLEINTLWDGLFHAAALVAVVTGVAVLYSRVTRSRARVWASRALWGWILLGWGAFNLVEGVVNHHLLGIHHVRGGPHQTWWDLGFLAVSALLVAAGWLLQRAAPPAGAPVTAA